MADQEGYARIYDTFMIIGGNAFGIIWPQGIGRWNANEARVTKTNISVYNNALSMSPLL